MRWNWQLGVVMQMEEGEERRGFGYEGWRKRSKRSCCLLARLLW